MHLLNSRSLLLEPYHKLKCNLNSDSIGGYVRISETMGPCSNGLLITLPVNRSFFQAITKSVQNKPTILSYVSHDFWINLESSQIHKHGHQFRLAGQSQHMKAALSPRLDPLKETCHSNIFYKWTSGLQASLRIPPLVNHILGPRGLSTLISLDPNNSCHEASVHSLSVSTSWTLMKHRVPRWA